MLVPDFCARVSGFEGGAFEQCRPDTVQKCKHLGVPVISLIVARVRLQVPADAMGQAALPLVFSQTKGVGAAL